MPAQKLEFLSRKEPERLPGGTPRRLRREAPRYVSRLLRLLSLCLVATALGFLGVDLLESLAKGGALVVHSLADVLRLSTAGDAAFVAPGRALQTLLQLPGWAVFGVLGVLLAFLAGRRH